MPYVGVVYNTCQGNAGYSWEPNWKSMEPPVISRVTLQFWLYKLFWCVLEWFSHPRVHMSHNICLYNSLFRLTTKKILKLCITDPFWNGIQGPLLPTWINFNPSMDKYRKTSNIRLTLVGNKIVDHSDVVGASPVGAAPTTSSFSTQHLALRYSAKTAAGQYESLLSVGIWCVLY